MSMIRSKPGSKPSVESANSPRLSKAKSGTSFWARLWAQRQLMLMLLPGLIFYITFRYGPIYGLKISFLEFNAFQGYDNSPWVGFAHFERLFTTDSEVFWLLMKNTLLVGTMTTFIGFPFAILFALVLNEIRMPRVKKLHQTISYLPTFLSGVIIASIFIELFSFKTGLINNIIEFLGGDRISFMYEEWGFHLAYQVSNLWAGLGSGAVIYLSALSAVDQEMYEAAEIDGCSRLKRIWYITIPSIMPTIVTMFILNIGGVIRVGADKALLFRNDLTLMETRIFATYVHDIGLFGSSKSYASAIGLFESAIAATILIVVNNVSKKRTGNSLW